MVLCPAAPLNLPLPDRQVTIRAANRDVRRSAGSYSGSRRPRTARLDGLRPQTVARAGPATLSGGILPDDVLRTGVVNGDGATLSTLTANVGGRARRATMHGREYLVAPLTLIVPGVLNGSKGALYYPTEEIARNYDAWNHIPIVVYHPVINGTHVSGRTPAVLEQSWVGNVYGARVGRGGRLQAEGWFDVEATRKVDPRVLDALLAGRPIELSTGLYTDNTPALGQDPQSGRPYSHIARNYRPDHLAILPDQVGACGLRDGCGVLVNAALLLPQVQPADPGQLANKGHPDPGQWVVVCNCAGGSSCSCGCGAAGGSSSPGPVAPVASTTPVVPSTPRTPRTLSTPTQLRADQDPWREVQNDQGRDDTGKFSSSEEDGEEDKDEKKGRGKLDRKKPKASKAVESGSAEALGRVAQQEDKVTRNSWRPLHNAFCATGPGGGVDPSCSPTEDGSKGEEIHTRWSASEAAYTAASRTPGVIRIGGRGIDPARDAANAAHEGDTKKAAQLHRQAEEAYRAQARDYEDTAQQAPEGSVRQILSGQQAQRYHIAADLNAKAAGLHEKPLGLHEISEAVTRAAGALYSRSGGWRYNLGPSREAAAISHDAHEEGSRSAHLGAAAAHEEASKERTGKVLKNLHRQAIQLHRAAARTATTNVSKSSDGKALRAALVRLGAWLVSDDRKGPKGMPGYGQIFFLPDAPDAQESGRVWYVGGDGDEQGFPELVQRKLGKVPGVSKVTVEAEGFPPSGKGWVQVYPEGREVSRNAWQPLSGVVIPQPFTTAFDAGQERSVEWQTIANAMMTCPECGRRVNSQEEECPYCGADLTENMTESLAALNAHPLDFGNRPRSKNTGRIKARGSGTGREPVRGYAQVGAVVPSNRSHVLGRMAATEKGATGHNPASWVEDEDIWEKAKAAANKGNYEQGTDQYWAVVAHIYQNMGGKVKSGGTKNSAEGWQVLNCGGPGGPPGPCPSGGGGRYGKASRAGTPSARPESGQWSPGSTVKAAVHEEAADAQERAGNRKQAEEHRMAAREHAAKSS